MNTNSPYYHWHRSSPGWILRRHRNGEHITANDVARVLEAHPDAINDPVIRDYATRAARGELPKPAGRPARSIAHYAWLMVAHDRAQEKIASWRDARRAGASDAPRKGRGQPSLSELAYEEVAREMKFGMCGRALANALSRMKKTHPLFCE